jgi:phosphoribosylanthranilate isomerase
MIRIKICGITRLEDAISASRLGVDALGYIFYEKSKRFISPANAAAIIKKIPPFITNVGVFVDASLETIKQVQQITGIGTIQLHGHESPEFCAQVSGRVIKAFSVSNNFRISIIREYSGLSAFLLDAWDENLKGGTGKPIEWSLAAKAAQMGNLILAGGLGPINLKEAIEIVKPYGVDLNSGVEVMPGQKNPAKMQEAVQIVRKAFQ